MITLASEAERMEDKEKKAANLVTKEEKDQLVPETAVDLVFLDDTSLLTAAAPKLRPGGFLLLHSREPVPEKIVDMTVISKKILADKTITLLRKVKLVPTQYFKQFPNTIFTYSVLSVQ